MASIVKRNGRFQVRWRSPDGRKQHSRTFDRKQDADRWLVKVSHESLTGGYVDPAEGRETVAAFAERWRAMKLHAPGTAAQVESHFRRHVLPELGPMPIARVRPSDVQTMVNRCSAKLKPTTVAVVYAHTASMFKAAVRDRIIIASPCVDIDLPRAEGRPVQLLTVDHVTGAVEHITVSYRAAVLLGAGAGLRPGEALGATTDRIDFLRGVVTVDRQLVNGKLRVPKTPASVRNVPVPRSITRALAAHLRAEGRTEGPLSLSRAGKPPSRQRYSDAWRRVRDAGVVPEWSTAHDLRHFYASMLIAAGLDVKTVQARLGHKSATTTLDVYGHLWGDHEDRTRDAVEEALGAALVPASFPDITGTAGQG